MKDHAYVIKQQIEKKENLRKLGKEMKEMKDQAYVIKQQIEKMALEKVQRSKDQPLTGISTLVAFSVSNLLAFLFSHGFQTGYPEAYKHPEDAFWNITDDIMSAEHHNKATVVSTACSAQPRTTCKLCPRPRGVSRRRR